MIGMQVLLVHVLCAQTLLGYNGPIYKKDKKIPSYIEFDKRKTSEKWSRSKMPNTEIAILLNLNENTTISLKGTLSDMAGGFYEFYTEKYKGVEVHGTKCIVYYDKGGTPVFVIGNFKTIEGIEVNAKITESAASQSAIKHFEIKELAKKVPASDCTESVKLELPKGKLVVHVKEGKAYLVYKFRIDSSSPEIHLDVFVDAISGEVVDSQNIVCTISGAVTTKYSGQRTIEMLQDQGMYMLRDYNRGNGIVTLDYFSNSVFTSSYSNWSSLPESKRGALDIHWGMEKTYDYYLDKFERNSFGGTGEMVMSYFVDDPSYSNAAWNGYSFIFGKDSVNNQFVSLDIVAHEFSHAYTQNSSELQYQAESGAINEGLSDALGACIEKWVKPANGIKIWQIGEDAVLLRDMGNPVCKYYHGMNWVDTTNPSQSNDWGGVHTNSGVFNYWFYLLTHGGSGTNQAGIQFTVDTIGFDKAAQICYMMNQLLTSDADYEEASLCSKLAVNNLGYDNNVLHQIHKAWGLVGVDNLNVYISGPSIPCDNSVYYIENLPDSCTVTWNWETSYGPVLELENVGDGSSVLDETATHRILDPGPPIIEGPLLLQNQPATNQCTLSKNGYSYIKNTIIATVKKNGTTIATLRKSVDTGINFTGGYAQAAHNYTGWYYPGVSATPFRSGDVITLLRGSTITLTADKFVGANITYSGTTPVNWAHNGSTISFYFSYLDIVDPYVPMTETLFPLQRPASLTITGTYSNSCESFQFTVVGMLPNIPSQLMADTEQNEGLYITTSGQSMMITRPTGDEQWTLSIINSSTGTKVYETVMQQTSSQQISTVGWPAGIYVVRAISGNGEWSAKTMVTN